MFSRGVGWPSFKFTQILQNSPYVSANPHRYISATFEITLAQVNNVAMCGRLYMNHDRRNRNDLTSEYCSGRKAEIARGIPCLVRLTVMAVIKEFWFELKQYLLDRFARTHTHARTHAQPHTCPRTHAHIPTHIPTHARIHALMHTRYWGPCLIHWQQTSMTI